MGDAVRCVVVAGLTSPTPRLMSGEIVDRAAKLTRLPMRCCLNSPSFFSKICRTESSLIPDFMNPYQKLLKMKEKILNLVSIDHGMCHRLQLHPFLQNSPISGPVSFLSHLIFKPLIHRSDIQSKTDDFTQQCRLSMQFPKTEIQSVVFLHDWTVFHL